jgi:hypothetical protein
LVKASSGSSLPSDGPAGAINGSDVGDVKAESESSLP